MSLKKQIDSDLRLSLLSGDKTTATTLRGLKSSILNAEIALGKRDQGLSDDETISILRKEAKKRHESAGLYDRGGDSKRAASERAELALIEKYLPQQMSDEELERLVNQAISEVGGSLPGSIGKIIARAKELTKGAADGGRIAGVVKEKVNQ